MLDHRVVITPDVIYENRFIKHVGFRCRIPHEHANVSYSFVSVFYKAEWLNVTSDETLHNWLLGYARITKIESVKPEDKRDFGYCGSTWYHLENQTSTDPYRLLVRKTLHFLTIANINIMLFDRATLKQISKKWSLKLVA